mgnify:CR=1 FL=1
MYIVILVLSLAVLILIAILVLRQWNLKKMNQQLQQIIRQFGTNELLRSNLPGKELNHFVANVNKLIMLFKQEEQATIRKNRELKQEITNISHDIRTPLTSIKGFSELLQDSQLSMSQKAEYLDIIQKKADTLLRTVNIFYEISQLESEDKDFKIQAFPLGELLVETILAFQADFENKNIEVSIEEAHFSHPVLADKEETERILLNLIQNALRYAQTFFQLSITENDDFLILEAKNDGETITPTEIEKIFDRSYTIDQSRQGGQTGLGLYIVKTIAKKQGGDVQASFQDGLFSLSVYFKKG